MPGLLDDLAARGANRLGDWSQVYYKIGGRLLTQHPRPFEPPMLLVHRNTLESYLRERVLRPPSRVTVLENCDAVALLTYRRRVQGIRLAPRTGDLAVDLDADLVVDATGRASRTPQWLQDNGFAYPAEDVVAVGLRYASQPMSFDRPAGLALATVVGPVPGRLDGAGLIAGDGHDWSLLTAAYGHPRELLDREALLAEAGRALPASTMEAVRAAQPGGPVRSFRVPVSRRRHYERLNGMPNGLIVVGDALATFNPLYGQGMSLAAMQAVTLRACLEEGVRGVSARFFEAASLQVEAAWQLSTGADLALPGVPGRRGPSIRLANAWVSKVLAAAEHDPVVADSFVRVTSLIDPVSALGRPGFVHRVLRPRPLVLTPKPSAAG